MTTKTFDEAVNELGGSPLRATNPEHAAVITSLLKLATEGYAENDIGKGYLALCRAMALASVANRKALDECYGNSKKHQADVKKADKLFDELTENSLSVIHAHKFYIQNAPFSVE